MGPTPGCHFPHGDCRGSCLSAYHVHVITPFVAVVTILAVARITRLITSDVIFAGPRGRALKRVGLNSRAAYLMTCDWCMSMWVAAPLTTVAWWAGHTPWYLIPVTALAASYVAGWLAQFGGE